MSKAMTPSGTRFRCLKRGLKLLAGSLLLLVALYLLAAAILTLIPANAGSVQPASGIEVFVISNGVHADLCLPTRTGALLWEDLIDLEPFGAAGIRYLSFGRGDRAFYLATPTWDELQPTVAGRALFLSSPAAMHVTAYLHAPQTGQQARRIVLRPEEYRRLVDFVKAAFQIDTWGEPIRIEGAGYGARDHFYEATGTYHLFCNSNSWTNAALIHSGVRTASWAPFDRCIFYYFPQPRG